LSSNATRAQTCKLIAFDLKEKSADERKAQLLSLGPLW